MHFSSLLLHSFFMPPPPTEIYTLSLHDALPIWIASDCRYSPSRPPSSGTITVEEPPSRVSRSEEHTSELQSRGHLVCRLLLEKKNGRSKLHQRNVYGEQ